MRNRRDRRLGHRIVVHVTNRTVVGLPFVCTNYMNTLIKGVLAKAQQRNPVYICHMMWMGNHYHLILSGQAKYLSPFYNEIDGELGKYLKRMTSLFQSKVWVGRPREQVLCTPEDVLDKIVYLYANPCTANLIETIEQWPGLSSWKQFWSGSYREIAHWIPPRKVKKIKNTMTSADDQTLTRYYLKQSEGRYELHLRPDHWKRCFKRSRRWTTQKIFAIIYDRLKEQEVKCQEARTIPVLHPRKLRRRSIHTHYKSGKKGRTPFLICRDPQLRRDLISSYRLFCKNCHQAWEKWKIGLLAAAQFPRGAYRPSMPLTALRI